MDNLRLALCPLSVRLSPRLALLGAAVLLLALAGCDQAPITPEEAMIQAQLTTGCKRHKVNLRIDTLFTSEDCQSPIGLCTRGTISGGGPLNGATCYTTLAAAPSAGLPAAVEPPTTLAYGGTLVITAKRGTLTFSDIGIFDQANLVWSEIDRPVSGTGIFAGASGVIFGYGDAPGGTGFVGTFKGELCY